MYVVIDYGEIQVEFQAGFQISTFLCFTVQ